VVRDWRWGASNGLDVDWVLTERRGRGEGAGGSAIGARREGRLGRSDGSRRANVDVAS
jgi:hypothetical protein